MPKTLDQHTDSTAIRSDSSEIFVSLELSKAKWLVTSLSPGSPKLSRRTIPGGDFAALMEHLGRLRAKVFDRAGALFPVVIPIA